jgi:acetyl-CoA carboxylase biotin carboxyl carrier protein
MSNDPQGADIVFIRALAELLRDSDLTEIEVQRDYGDDAQLSVRVARQPAAAAPIYHAPPALPHTQAANPSSAPASSAPPSAVSADPADDPGAVASPMVGTVYLQAEPGSPPFVKVGDMVSEGQTILIIEAMKTMNQIPAPHAGRVKRILVEDGSPVEFGAPLIILE